MEKFNFKITSLDDKKFKTGCFAEFSACNEQEFNLCVESFLETWDSVNPFEFARVPIVTNLPEMFDQWGMPHKLFWEYLKLSQEEREAFELINETYPERAFKAFLKAKSQWLKKLKAAKASALFNSKYSPTL